MGAALESKQSDRSVEKNTSFLREQLDGYKSQVESVDTYQNIRTSINAEHNSLIICWIGKGGTFDYDVSPLRQVVAVDLFLEDLKPEGVPSHVLLKNGSALDLPFQVSSFAGVTSDWQFGGVLLGKRSARRRRSLPRA